MDTDRIEGTARNMAGRAQEAVGNAIGDSETQARGAVNQVRGQAQDTMGQMSDMIRDQPMMAAAIALGIGYILGRFRI